MSSAPEGRNTMADEIWVVEFMSPEGDWVASMRSSIYVSQEDAEQEASWREKRYGQPHRVRRFVAAPPAQEEQK
jgi:hypothetical protein